MADVIKETYLGTLKKKTELTNNKCRLPEYGLQTDLNHGLTLCCSGPGSNRQVPFFIGGDTGSQANFGRTFYLVPVDGSADNFEWLESVAVTQNTKHMICPTTIFL